MKKIIFCLLVILISLPLAAQQMIFQYQEGKSYCTIEVDTTLKVNLGTFRATNYLNAPYYEMTFIPKFEYTETGETLLLATPSFHYYAYLAQVYGEVENTNLEDPDFALKFEIGEGGNTLTLRSDETERKRIYNMSSFSKKDNIGVFSFPDGFSKTDKIDWDKFPKNLRKDLQKRLERTRTRLNL